MPDQSSIQQKYKKCKYKVQVIVACLAGMLLPMSTNDASQVNKSVIYIGTCRIADNCRLHRPKDRVMTPLSSCALHLKPTPCDSHTFCFKGGWSLFPVCVALLF